MNSKQAYKYSIEECDIQDKVKAEAFRRKRLEWMDWLSGKDSHAISNQIYSILWDYALFCTVNELRKVAIENPEEKVGFNSPLMRLFDAGFATTQATAIRRLIEKPKADPKRAIISLRSILKDIRENINLISRENYVCYDGLPYDYEVVYQEYQLGLVRDGRSVRVKALPISGPKAWYVSERVHKNFDRLSQVNPRDRKRTDFIKTELLDFLENQIEKCEDIKKYVDKFIAHAATPKTRLGLTESQKAITLEHLKVCHKTIYQVASFIKSPLLWESSLGGLPVPQYNHLSNLNKALVSTDNLGKAQKKWDEIAKIISQWDSTSLWPVGFIETRSGKIKKTS